MKEGNEKPNATSVDKSPLCLLPTLNDKENFPSQNVQDVALPDGPTEVKVVLAR